MRLRRTDKQDLQSNEAGVTPERTTRAFPLERVTRRLAPADRVRVLYVIMPSISIIHMSASSKLYDREQ